MTLTLSLESHLISFLSLQLSDYMNTRKITFESRTRIYSIHELFSKNSQIARVRLFSRIFVHWRSPTDVGRRLLGGVRVVFGRSSCDKTLNPGGAFAGRGIGPCGARIGTGTGEGRGSTLQSHWSTRPSDKRSRDSCNQNGGGSHWGVASGQQQKGGSSQQNILFSRAPAGCGIFCCGSIIFLLCALITGTQGHLTVQYSTNIALYSIRGKI